MYNEKKTVRILRKKGYTIENGKVTRNGPVYHEIMCWDGRNWRTAPEEPATMKEAKAVATKRYGWEG